MCIITPCMTVVCVCYLLFTVMWVVIFEGLNSGHFLI